MIPNGIITDTRLSAGARILYCYLASKPDNWQIWNNDIKNNLAISNDHTLAKYFKELMTYNWIARTLNRTNDGKKLTGGYNYELLNQDCQCSANDENTQITEIDSHNNTYFENNTNCKEIEISDNKQQKRKKEIIPPNFEEAKKYYEEKGYTFGFEDWYYNYESKDWMMGKTKIKSWKATMKTWDINNKKKNNNYKSNPIKHDWGANIQYKSPEELRKEEQERQKFWDDYYEKERKEKGITGC